MSTLVLLQNHICIIISVAERATIKYQHVYLSISTGHMVIFIPQVFRLEVNHKFIFLSGNWYHL